MATISIYGSEIEAAEILEAEGIEVNRTSEGIEVADDDAPAAAAVLVKNAIIYVIEY